MNTGNDALRTRRGAAPRWQPPDRSTGKRMTAQKPTVRLGLDRLLENPPAGLEHKRLGLLCNAASVGRDLVHTRHRIRERFGGRLTALFSPQHGLFAEKQDNMIESAHCRDPLLNIPVFSLYSETRAPTRQMYDAIDILLVDLQDVGTRVYTFVYTISHCMEAASRFGKPVIVLDRPNPVGGLLTEGNCLDGQWRSFVGRFPMPMRHGLTVGELARLFNDAYGIGCDLTVIPMEGWGRDMLFDDTGLTWIAPSPNLPTPASALVYPGQVILEGTNISEGRGTTQPFEIFGAPYINVERVGDFVSRHAPDGIFLRPLMFEPTANKWAGKTCRGFQIHVTDPRAYRPYRTSLALVQAVIHNHPDDFRWKRPPYEYEYDRMPIDLILGDGGIRHQLEKMVPVKTLEASWRDGLEAFNKLRASFLLYP
jgi:uncharacterized protein YbbC (DUF1343 family)